MRPLTTVELAAALEVDRWLIDQAVSRGIFAPKNTPEPGKPRLWDFPDAMRFAVLLSVSAWVPLFAGRPRKATGQPKKGPDDRTNAERISDALSRKRLHGYTDDAAFLLITNTTFPGGGVAYDVEIVRASKLASASQRRLSESALRVGAVKSEAALQIDLGAIEARLLEAWPS